MAAPLYAIETEPLPPNHSPPLDENKPKGDTEKPLESESRESLPDTDWFAVKQSFIEDKGAVVLSGSAWVKIHTIKLEADHIIFFRQTRELYAEGHIRLREGESEFSAEVAYVDVANDRGYLVDATLRVSKPAEGSGGLSFSSVRDSGAFAAALKGEKGFVSARDPYGIYLLPTDDPQGRLNFIFKAEKVVRHGRLHYTAQNAFLTNDDMARPMYGLKIKELNLFMREAPRKDDPTQSELRPRMIQGKGARLKVGPVTLFPFPTITYDMTRPQTYFRTDFGNSSRWGQYGLFRIGRGLGGDRQNLFDPTHLYIDTDYRLKRGAALGTEFKYLTGIRPEDPEASNVFERGRGSIQVYGMNEYAITKDKDRARSLDNRLRRITGKIDGAPRRTYDANLLFTQRRALDRARPPSQAMDLYKDDMRGMIDFNHHQPLVRALGINNLELDFKYQRQSDRDFMLEYFPNNYYRYNQPEALVSAKTFSDNYYAELLYRTSPQLFDGSPPRSPVDFGTFTNYEPALNWNYLQTRLPGGFYFSSAAQAARLQREFERKVIDQDTYEALRLYGSGQIERPFRFMGMNWRPYVGVEGAGYDKSRQGGDAIVQWAPKYGLDVSTRLYGEFPGVRNEELGIRGLRHIVEPRLEYSAIDNTSVDPADVLDFDQRDNLRGVHVLRLSLDQKFVASGEQLGSGWTVGGLSMYMDIYPRASDSKRLLNGGHQDLFHMNGFINVHRYVQVRGDVGISLEQKIVETTMYTASIDPGGRWRIVASERFNHTDNDRGILGSDAINLRVDFQLSERWGLTVQQSTERKKGFLIKRGRQHFDIALSRRYGSLVGSFRYGFDNNINDSSFNFGLAPAFAYRNLVVPTGNLVVPAGQVEEEGEAPEERNFDPFNLSKKKKPSTRASGNAPAPAPDKNVPGGAMKGSTVPTEIVSAREDSQANVPAEVVSADEPARPELKVRPKNLYRDDWGGGR